MDIVFVSSMTSMPTYDSVDVSILSFAHSDLIIVDGWDATISQVFRISVEKHEYYF